MSSINDALKRVRQLDGSSDGLLPSPSQRLIISRKRSKIPVVLGSVIIVALAGVLVWYVLGSRINTEFLSRKEPVSREPAKVSSISSKISKTEVPKPASMAKKTVEPAPVREKVVRRPAQVETESQAAARPVESKPAALIPEEHPTESKAAAAKRARTEPLLVKEKRAAPAKLEATAQKPRLETGQAAQLQTPSKAIPTRPKGTVKAAQLQTPSKAIPTRPKGTVKAARELRPKKPAAAARKKSDSLKKSSPASVTKQPEPIKKSPPPRQGTRQENLVSEYRRAIKLDPSNALAYLKLGNIFFFEMNDLGQAQEMYSKVLEIDPDNKLGHNNLGVVFLKQNSFDLAETEFTAALEIDPAYADAQYNRACLSAKRGQKIEAMARLLRAAQLDPAVHRWAANDEDLRSLKDMPEFKRFIRQPKTDNNEAKK